MAEIAEIHGCPDGQLILELDGGFQPILSDLTSFDLKTSEKVTKIGHFRVFSVESYRQNHAQMLNFACLMRVDFL